MKLLLTSSGITTKSIEHAFQDMLNKPFSETEVAFIPTAMNTVPGDKWWVIKDLVSLRDLGCKVDIVDISAVPKEHWLPRLEHCDVLFVEGGDTYHLMECIHQCGAFEEIKRLMDGKVYVGVSAGSAICAKDLALLASQQVYDEALDRKEDVQGFGVIPYYVFPHLNSTTYFPKVVEENFKQFVPLYKTEMYLLDDMSALSVVDGVVKVISEGAWVKLNG
jgi:dipeptidase E